MNIEKRELIERLGTISALYDKTKEIESKMKNYTPVDNYERQVQLPPFPGEYKSGLEREAWAKKIDHTANDAVSQMEEAYKNVYEPKKPDAPQVKSFEKPGATSEENSRSSQLGCLTTGSGIFGAIFTLSALFSIAGGAFIFTAIIAVIFDLMFAYSIIKSKEIKSAQKKRADDALIAYNREKATIFADYQAKLQAYEADCEAFKAKLQTFLNNYISWREVCLQRAAEEARIREKLIADGQMGVKKIYDEEYIPAINTLNGYNNILSAEYLPAIDTIRNLLINDRADDLKEAINLYEDIAYRERQLALEQEKEEQRQREEEQRRQDEERRYREERIFQERKELQRQREEEKRQKDAERRHREEMDQRDRQERNRQAEEKRRADKAARDERAATERQCRACASLGSCTLAFKRANCTSFRPK